MNRLPWSTMGSKNSSENHSLKQEKKPKKQPWKLRITIQLLIVSGGKCFAIFKVSQKPYGPLSSQNPGLFYLTSKTDNSQHLSSKKTAPNRQVGPGISITIPRGEDNMGYPTPALLPALGKESHVVVWFSMAKPSFPRLGLPPGLGQSPGGVNCAASESTGWNCTSCTLLHLSWPLGNSRGGATPTSHSNVGQAPLNQLRHFNHGQETFQIV